MLRTPSASRRLQRMADANIERFGLRQGERRAPSMKPLPFAITLDPGSSLANQTGSWRTAAPGLSGPAAAVQQRLPGRREHPEMAVPCREPAITTPPGSVLMEDNPLPGVMGRVCYHPCEDACNRGQLDEAVGIHAIERFLGRTAWENKGGNRSLTCTSHRANACWSLAPGQAGSAAAYHLTRLGHTPSPSARPGRWPAA